MRLQSLACAQEPGREHTERSFGHLSPSGVRWFPKLDAVEVVREAPFGFSILPKRSLQLVLGRHLNKVEFCQLRLLTWK